jgi:hypothetical protein
MRHFQALLVELTIIHLVVVLLVVLLLAHQVLLVQNY